ncbi:MAG TPA: hypothetical protein VEI57_10975 [Nitrospirota bacterium]|nr:hypothetical protein [Nitrospirota bacterium]
MMNVCIRREGRFGFREAWIDAQGVETFGAEARLAARGACQRDERDHGRETTVDVEGIQGNDGSAYMIRQASRPTSTPAAALAVRPNVLRITALATQKNGIAAYGTAGRSFIDVLTI